MGHPLNEQQLAALDRHLHCAVLANAGSGKTRILIERFIRAIVLDGVQMDSIVAITFTKAAAAEMRERIYERVEELLHDAKEREPYVQHLPERELIGRLRAIGRTLALARISTFHSFCAGLTRQYADAVGLPFDVRDADEREASYLANMAISTTLRRVADPSHSLHRGFVDLIQHLSLNSIEGVVTKIARSRTKVQLAQSLVQRTHEEIVDERREHIQSIQREIADQALTTIIHGLAEYTHLSHYDRLQQECRRIQGLLQTKGFSTDVKTELGVLRDTFLKKDLTINLVKRDKQAKQADGVPELLAIENEVKDILFNSWEQASEHQLLDLTKVIAEIAVCASEEYHRLKRDRNVIDFDDMIHGAITLLEIPEIQNAVRSSITHIMIDEFQDTDPSQFYILELLAPDLVEPSPRGPIVFVVGDDKQSIYQFRDADVRLFRKAREVISATNLHYGADSGMRKLTKSFRMHPDLCDAVNALCMGFFANPSSSASAVSGYDVDYEPLIAGLTLAKDPATCRVHIAENGSMEEADLVAQSIARTLESREELRPKDIAVLVPTNTLKTEVAGALRRLNVPFTIYGGRSFFSRPEVADVRNALIACIEPSNNRATASVMRSPILQCSDDDILAASLKGQTSSIQDGLTQLVTSGVASDRQRAACGFFQRFTEELATNPVHEIIERMLNHTNWYTTVAAEERYDQMVVNIDKLIATCRDVISQGGASLHDVLRAIAVPTKDDEPEGTILSDDDAVHVMTLHMSKGLEFKVVALAGLASKRPSDSIIETTEIGLTFSLPKDYRPVDQPASLVQIAPSLSHTCNKWIASQRRRAEDRRLLYVALTRAKEELILCLPEDRHEQRPQGLAGMLTDGLARYEFAQVINPEELASAVYSGGSVEEDRPLLDMTMQLDPLERWTRTPSSTITYQHSSGEASTKSSSTIGSAIHDVLAELLKESTQLSDDDLMERIVRSLLTSGLSRGQASEAAVEVFTTLRSGLVTGISHVLTDVRIEQQLAMMDNDLLMHGVLDVRLPMIDGLIEVWDWKTSSIRGKDHMLEQGAIYTPQMQGYASLCFAAYPECKSVRTRLVFTKALLKGMDPSFVIEFERPTT